VSGKTKKAKDKEYEVDHIVSASADGYTIRWEGYGPERDTVEAFEQLAKIPWVIDAFHKLHPESLHMSEATSLRFKLRAEKAKTKAIKARASKKAKAAAARLTRALEDPPDRRTETRPTPNDPKSSGTAALLPTTHATGPSEQATDGISNQPPRHQPQTERGGSVHKGQHNDDEVKDDSHRATPPRPSNNTHTFADAMFLLENVPGIQERLR